MVGPGKLNVELLQNFKFCYVIITDLRICRFQFSFFVEVRSRVSCTYRKCRQGDGG